MSTTPKAILEELARSRGFFHRHDVLRAMVSLAQAVKATHTAPVFGHDKTRIVGMIKELVQHLSRTDEVRRYRPEGLSYDKGQEKKLMAELVFLLKKIKEEQETETLEEIRARKLRLDRALIRGQKLLAVGKVKDALAMFNEALTNYVDEHMVFYHIGNKLAAADQYKLSLRYLLKGMEAAPREGLIVRAAALAMLKLGKIEQAEQAMRKALKLGQTGAENHALMAEILEKLGRLEEASVEASRALDVNPMHKTALKIHERINKATPAA